MSRIGKKPVAIPAGVTLTLNGQTVAVKGPTGQLSWTVVDEVLLKLEGAELTLTPRDDSTRARAMWGLSRTLVNNMVVGVTAGYETRVISAITGSSSKYFSSISNSGKWPGRCTRV